MRYRYGGVKDSGIGYEGGTEAPDARMQVKLTTIQRD
jgi:acyl-CoA reductase-like NAD-dependent aldehyde dehydrogenase